MKRELYLLLDYPTCREERALRILKELQKLGVELLEFVAKGYRGTVFKGKLNRNLVAIKVKRSDVLKEKLIEKECEILKHLENFSIKTEEQNPAPKVHQCTEEYLIMEFIEGLPFSRALKNYDPKTVVKEALRSCYFLDRAGVKHSEIKGEKHLLFDGQRIRVIDFESAKFSERPRNLLQFVGYHLIRRKELLRELGISQERVRELIELYKENPDEGFKAFILELRK
ncbi:putative serine/threonine protein kinase [Phorcysia thermohydrogeniphila]|uniref:Putative serine/threonine protein kinase n=2 Tax=Phorcysia thermohydrogeniphila TaxID=936138 RepID=A0A4V2PDJ6_9BACT|nr:putative serine/threonine protein kinase [Phorcysia thermohydrogeniphila]